MTQSDFTDSLGYANGQQIKYKIKAYNTNGESIISPQRSGLVYAQSEPITAVSGITAETTAESATLFWNALTSDIDTGYSIITSYKVEIDNGSGYTEIIPSATSNVDFTVSGLEEEATYAFRISGVNKHGVGPPATAVVTIIGVPDQIEGVTVETFTAR